ncbi:methanol oxidation system protein MoxJ [Methylocella silvestris]|uniref:Methanol oxidation system protein MoxJ n=1 Tax=Methylocella silvestris TaxID=199596 RepID=A0A2J7TEV5_METSI|nr:methanol oxidation system protein MoxJ [Methylocella silvestris]PNG25293.1 methanol oxidation system protein MoxJ [Methylocella silvestris]
MRRDNLLFGWLAGAALVAFSGGAIAEQASADKSKELRICASEKEAPFSIKGGAGFENHIAIALAEAMNRKPVFVWTARPAIYLVRDYLDKNLCDVVIGVDTGDPRVLSSAPYYRSAYVFLSRENENLDIESWKDPRIDKVGHIAVSFGSPGEVMLKDLGKYEDNMSYLYSLVNFKAPRNEYTQIPPSKIVEEVVLGNARLAAAFAPEVARYVKASPEPLRMTVISDDTTGADGTKVSQHFDQSVGVRKDDVALLEEVNAGLAKAQPRITSILKEEGIPLLDKGM